MNQEPEQNLQSETEPTPGGTVEKTTEPQPGEKEETAEAGGGTVSDPDEKVITITQEKFNEAINKQHKRYRDEERRRREIEQERDRLRQKLEEQERSRPRPSVPPVPEWTDPDYDRKMRERDQAIEKAKEYELEQRQAQEQQQNQLAEQQRQTQLAVQREVESYSKRIADIGLDAQEMAQKEQIVVSYNLPGDINRFLLRNENGPLVVRYLAENQALLSDIAGMHPVDAAAHIVANVVPEAVKYKPKIKTVPEPLDQVESGNAPGKGDPGLKHIAGATFE